MAFPFVEVFLGLLLAYMVYSVWAQLDARLPIGAALVLLVVTAVVDALGATSSANTLAEFVFFLLGAGVLLLLVEHVREGRRAPAAAPDRSVGPTEPVTTEPTNEVERSPDQALDGLEQEAVPLTDAPGREDDQQEQPGDREPEQRHGEVGERGPEEEEGGPDGESGGEDRQDEVPRERVDSVGERDLTEG